MSLLSGAIPLNNINDRTIRGPGEVSVNERMNWIVANKRKIGNEIKNCSFLISIYESRANGTSPQVVLPN